MARGDFRHFGKEMTYDEFLEEWKNASPFVEVKTSGSTGEPKQVMVEKDRMIASAQMTGKFLELEKGYTALLCMPVDYIAGKMMVVRSDVLSLKLTAIEPKNRPFRELKAQFPDGFDFVALVPSQVFETLKHKDEADIMRRSKHIIIGGGHVSKELQKLLTDFPNAVWSTYGMTETLSHIAMRRLNGDKASEWYSPLQGVEVSLNEENCIVIDAPRVSKDVVVTNDIGEMSDGKFRVVGRKDNVICSGGIKIQIEEVESLLAQYLHSPFAISKQADEKFGEVVVLVTVENDLKAVEEICRQRLPRYWKPKRYYHFDSIPQTETGKIARAEIEKILLNK